MIIELLSDTDHPCLPVGRGTVTLFIRFDLSQGAHQEGTLN